VKWENYDKMEKSVEKYKQEQLDSLKAEANLKYELHIEERRSFRLRQHVTQLLLENESLKAQTISLENEAKAAKMELEQEIMDYSKNKEYIGFLEREYEGVLTKIRRDRLRTSNSNVSFLIRK